MRFSTRTLSLLLFGVLLALAAPVAASADWKDVIRDCSDDGDLDRDYSDEELEEAYANLPSDIDEYSNCREVIRQAQAGGRGSEDGAGGREGAAGAGPRDGGAGRDSGAHPGRNESSDDVVPEGGTAGDQQEIARRAEEARRGDRSTPALEPAASGGAGGDDDAGLPAAAIVAIILLALAAAGGGLYATRERLPVGLTSRLPGFGSRPDR